MSMDVRAFARLEQPPLLLEHPATWQLLRLAPLYERGAQRDALFVTALRENSVWHYRRNALYRSFCDASGFAPETLRGEADLARLPALHADIFKLRDLSTLRGSELLHVTSSGTGGRPTAIALDAETLARMWAMGLAAFREDGLTSERSVDYLVFAPPPREGRGVGNAHFFSSLMELAPARTVTYALEGDAPQGLRMRTEEIHAQLSRAAAAQTDVRLLGLPALIAEAALLYQGPPLRLNASSLVLTGGGWKGSDRAPLSKPGFRSLLSERWGVDPQRVRDLYGMTEHAVHYLECSEHRFHAPAYARVRIVDPLSGRASSGGEWGALHLMNPGFTTAPLQSLLTADIGRWLGACRCGRNTPAFEVRGRSNRAEREGCAATTLARLRT